MRGDFGSGDWLIVSGEGAPAIRTELLNEALAASPLEVADGGVLLPRRRDDATRCRICGTDEMPSKEHVPPRSAGNRGTFTAHTFDEWVERDENGKVPGGTTHQGGVFGYVLCEPCNNRTGRFATEYKKWSGMAARWFVERMPPLEEMNAATTSPALAVQIPDCLPGTFGRQVLSILCAVAGPWMIADKHPELRAALLRGESCNMPSGLSMGMALCAPVAGMTAGPSVQIDLVNQTWRWVAVAAHPPFAFEIELDSSEQQPDHNPMCEIGGFLTADEHTRCMVDLDLFVAFVNTMFPGDWRTLGQIEQKLDIYGRRTHGRRGSP